MRGADRLGEDGAGLVTLPCVGMLPPSFIDFVLSRKLADGVMLAGCAENACYHRRGDEWVRQRIAGERDPYLRKRVPRERLLVNWLAEHRVAGRRRAFSEFRARLRQTIGVRDERD